MLVGIAAALERTVNRKKIKSGNLLLLEWSTFFYEMLQGYDRDMDLITPFYHTTCPS